MARPAGLEPTHPWFVAGVVRQKRAYYQQVAPRRASHPFRTERHRAGPIYAILTHNFSTQQWRRVTRVPSCRLPRRYLSFDSRSCLAFGRTKIFMLVPCETRSKGSFLHDRPVANATTLTQNARPHRRYRGRATPLESRMSTRTFATPVITDMRIIPVAGRDSMLL